MGQSWELAVQYCLYNAVMCCSAVLCLNCTLLQCTAVQWVLRSAVLQCSKLPTLCSVVEYIVQTVQCSVEVQFSTVHTLCSAAVQCSTLPTLCSVFEFSANLCSVAVQCSEVPTL